MEIFNLRFYNFLIKKQKVVILKFVQNQIIF